jgi:hypothetical protein
MSTAVSLFAAPAPLQAPARPVNLRSALLDQLATGEVRWLSYAELANDLAADVRSVDYELLALQRRGLVDLRPGPQACLSPLGAARLGVEVTLTTREVYLWSPLPDRPPDDLDEPPDRPRFDPAIYAAVADDVADDDPIAQAVDPYPGPETLAMLREQFLAIFEPYWNVEPPRQPPFPRIFYGLGSAWDSSPVAPAVCPDCSGRSLTRIEYCLRCDRWGFDA